MQKFPLAQTMVAPTRHIGEKDKEKGMEYHCLYFDRLKRAKLTETYSNIPTLDSQQ